MIRTTNIQSGEESFKIYQGSSTSGTVVYTQPSISNSDEHTWEICLSGGSYTLMLTDSYGDGWEYYSNLKLYFNDEYYNTYWLDYGFSDTVTFNTPIVPP